MTNPEKGGFRGELTEGVILHWIKGVLTSKEPGLRLSIKEVHGLVTLLNKGGGSINRESDYRPVVLLNILFQLVSYIIQERLF
jgi:hypothetical protein